MTKLQTKASVAVRVTDAAYQKLVGIVEGFFVFLFPDAEILQGQVNNVSSVQERSLRQRDLP